MLEKIDLKMRTSVSSRLRKELADRGQRVSEAWSNEQMERVRRRVGEAQDVPGVRER
jgi:hypothetical protein